MTVFAGFEFLKFAHWNLFRISSFVLRIFCQSGRVNFVKSISLAQARLISLRAQGLAENAAPFGQGKPAVLRTVEHLGYIQVDTISVVQRAHHHVLWSRVPDYQPDMLHQLHDPDRAVFEYWNHAASYLPMCDFRFSRPLMQKFKREGHWSDESPELKRAMRRMMTRIKSKGALLLRDVESKTFVGGWSNVAPSKIEKRALHELWMRGQVMIRNRQGFQKVFDLPERIIPAAIDQTMPTKLEAGEFHIKRALRALGVARLSELHYLQDAERAGEVKTALRGLLKNGEAIELRVTEFPDVPCYALPEALSQAAPLQKKLIRILSPFDNLVIQRERMRWLFNFDYVIECYVTAAKRKYGYFVLPILCGDKFIGRMDAKADRAKRRLLIHRLFFEEGFSDSKALQKELARFTKFQDCDTFEVRQIINS